MFKPKSVIQQTRSRSRIKLKEWTTYKNFLGNIGKPIDESVVRVEIYERLRKGVSEAISKACLSRKGLVTKSKVFNGYRLARGKENLGDSFD